MEGPTKVAVLPIFRRYWLWHAWNEGSAVATLAEEASAAGRKTLRDWRQGQNLEEKAQLLGQHATRWVSEQAGPGLTAAAAAAACRLARRSLPGFQGAAAHPHCSQRPQARTSTPPAGPAQAVPGVAQAGDCKRGESAQPRLPVRAAHMSLSPPAAARRCSTCVATELASTCAVQPESRVRPTMPSPLRPASWALGGVCCMQDGAGSAGA